jgi:hypothetical protein
MRMSNRKYLGLMGGLLLTLAMIFWLSSCAPAQNAPGIEIVPADANIITVGNIQRYTDEEAGVVCRILPGYREPSISCLPIKDTLLDQ